MVQNICSSVKLHLKHFHVSLWRKRGTPWPSRRSITILTPTVYLSFACLSEHKVLFLKGSSCSGKVFIEHGDNNYWLSGSKQTWNRESASTVCRQMLCGRARNFNYTIPDATNAVSKKSYSCSSNTTSLFDCEKDTLPSDHNYTVATVRCSGIVKQSWIICRLV